MHNKKFLVVLGASDDQVHMIKTAQKLGYGTVAFDANPAAPGLKVAEFGYAINFSDITKVADQIRSLRSEGIDVAGVSTMGSDIPHLLHEVAMQFGWPGPSAECATLATNKYLMKKRFSEAGVPVPRYGLVSSAEDVLAFMREWNVQRTVIKPVDRAGSRGVSVISNEAEVAARFQHAKENSICGDVLLEEYAEGPQISTESIVYDDFISTPGFANRVYEGMESFHPQIMENGGWVPSSLDAGAQSKVKAVCETAARALDVVRGPAKGDIVICRERGPLVIEIAARLSGGDFCESLVPLSTGYNYVEDIVRIALGELPRFESLQNVTSEYFCANRYFFAPPGRLRSIEGLESFAGDPLVKKMKLFYQAGNEIPPIQNHGQRLGVFVVCGKERDQVVDKINEIYDKVRFQIDGNIISGRPAGFDPGRFF